MEKCKTVSRWAESWAGVFVATECGDRVFPVKWGPEAPLSSLDSRSRLLFPPSEEDSTSLHQEEEGSGGKQEVSTLLEVIVFSQTPFNDLLQ